MVILAQRWIEELRKLEPNRRIELSGGGTAAGVAALLNGTADLALASRSLRASEHQRAGAQPGRRFREVAVARDVLSIWVHPTNPVSEVTRQQLHDVLAGRITRWTELGGRDEEIVVYGREPGSGTQWLVKEQVLADDDFRHDVELLPGTAAIVDSVAHDPKALGYGGLAYAKRLKHLRVLPGEADGTIGNALENSPDGLVRPLYVDGIDPFDADVEAFIAFALSPRGQDLVREVGYLPLEPGSRPPGAAADAGTSTGKRPRATAP